MKKPISIISLFFLIHVLPMYGQLFTFHSDSPFGLQITRPDTSRPAQQIMFFDVDNDGDLDAFLSGLYYFDNVDQMGWNNMHYFLDMQENVGDKWHPAFAERKDAFQNFPIPEGYFFPAIGDINKDGKADVITFGEVNFFGARTMMYARSKSGSPNEDFDVIRGDSMTLDNFVPESFYIPELVDLDKDGDLDILMSGFDPAFSVEDGSDIPTIYYAQNPDNISDPEFYGWFPNPYELIANPLVEILAAGDIDNDGDIDLLGPTLLIPADSNNHIFVHLNQPNATGRPSFQAAMESPFGLPTTHGDQQLLFPEIVDLDGDGDQDMFVFKGNTTARTLDYYVNNNCTPSTTPMQVELCEGDVFNLGGISYSEPGDYTVHLAASNGCDSIIQLSIELFQIPNTFLNETICEGESITIGTDNFTAPGNYTVYVAAANGCDSIIYLTLIVHETYTTSLQESICEGASYQVGNETFSATGHYQVLLNSAAGCDSLISLDLAVTLIDNSVAVASQTASANQSNAAYQWYDCDSGNIIDGATLQSFEPTVTGNYAVHITLNGCTNNSECVNITITSAEDIILSEKIVLYPNPTTGDIRVLNNTFYPIEQVTLYNSLGQLLETIPWSGHQYLELNKWESGCYYVKLKINNTETIKTLIKI